MRASLIVVYVAGPYRADSAWGIEQNVRRAEALALDVWDSGAVALCPHSMLRFYQGARPDAIWLAGDLELLARCDALVLTDDWERSSGARAEVEFARQEQIPTFTSIASLREWLAATRKASLCARLEV